MDTGHSKILLHFLMERLFFQTKAFKGKSLKVKRAKLSVMIILGILVISVLLSLRQRHD